ncbi:DUF2894 domain-containing protein [Stenotrophomonas rhizophila]|uniref:DUF2894 domain-containing protein n=1 Tax=Stenotrophomonas rhizophila TaxID=216778 RepID=UPI0016395255|nr:DUF2894 domain-containing protein [Stenotrophomonas rhizophila]
MSAQLDAWRQQQLDRHDPLGFAVIEALQTRAQAQQGAVRKLLDARLVMMVAAYAARIAEQTARAPRRGRGAPAPGAERASPLSGLLATLAAHAQTQAPPVPRDAPLDTAPAPAFPALPAISEFRDLWATVRNESQKRISLAQGPGDGGPLNSAVLVHRSLTLMSELSPGYLQHFLMYLDNLAWLEQLQPRTATPARDVGRIPKPRRARTPKA